MSIESRLIGGILGKDSCWNWQGHKSPKGYGCVWVDGKSIRAHRLAYAAWVGAIPEGMQVLHRCDNPACVNPSHLWVGTNRQNVADKMSKGRQARKPTRKLTVADVHDIRSGMLSYREASLKYGVVPHTIGDIRTRKTWKHV